MKIKGQKYLFFTLDIAMYVSLMEQPTWRWICFEFCVRFTAYFDQNISVAFGLRGFNTAAR